MTALSEQDNTDSPSAHDLNILATAGSFLIVLKCLYSGLVEIVSYLPSYQIFTFFGTSILMRYSIITFVSNYAFEVID